ncbi:terpenoid cyclases/protein prenyltransferase alpha-alpha toroid [Xylariaceae sp. FL1651]|nr:terpenoid cyclases/protein prenyltransferase alpha-alpha toroid [Xylariaceae sp. FL1651]
MNSSRKSATGDAPHAEVALRKETEPSSTCEKAGFENMFPRQDGKTLDEDVRRSLQQAVQFAWSCQKPDSHWVAPVSADATFTAEYVMFKYAIPGLSLEEDGAVIRKWLLADQTDDGSWTLAPGLPGNLSTTVEAYLALKILGVPASHPAMKRAANFVRSKGGVPCARFFTRFFLATFGLYPWSAIPQMPAELILMPTWATLNIYVLSSWARSTLIPILIVRHHEPVYALPNGHSPDNDFLDELWLDPSHKNVGFTRPLQDLFWGKDRDAVELLFTVGDKLLSKLGGLKKGPQRRLARRRCIDWLLEHQEESGDWAGFFPPMHGSVWALLLEGFPLHHKAVHLGLEAIERLAITDAKGKWLQSTVSPCWDTALMANALCDAGQASDPRLAKAAQWLRDHQLMVDHGDWRIYSPNSQAGGWSFEYYNTFYPDVDDAAVVVMTLVKQDPSSITSDSVLNGVEWILGMQNHDSGWGAFDINNDARWLHKIPFSDMDSLIDPSTSDVTGRMLECFGLLLTNRKGARLPEPLRRRLIEAAQGALKFLVKEQESKGAASGSWWGRWGNNYNYGTTNVLRGLEFWCDGNPEVTRAAMRAIRWLRECQNPDGGWGETLLSYVDSSLAGQGESTSAQTSWAVDSLLRYLPASDPAITRGIQWLISNQTVQSEYGEGMGWRTELYVGTGFPDVLYLGYPYYHHIFAIQALSRYLKCSSHQEVHALASRGIDISPDIFSRLSRRDLLFMVLGSRGDIDVFLSIAKRLSDCRIRIATHPVHRTVVQQHGFEFYDVGGSPDEFSQILGKEPNVLWSIANGDFALLRQSLCFTFQRFWIASFGQTVYTMAMLNAEEKKSFLQTPRPFLADAIISGPATTAHIHAAEKLRIPFVLVSPQPATPTRDFPPVLTMTSPNFPSGKWRNYVAYFSLDLLNWLALGSFLNRLRAAEYGMRALSWASTMSGFLHDSVPSVGLWSSQVVPRPSEWKENVIVGGYTSLNRETNYIPPDSLQEFLNTDEQIVAVSFGSMTIPDPVMLISMVSYAARRRRAKAVICRSWSAKREMGLTIPSHVYLCDAVPHSWLLPHVHGFFHHGGAGHTAAGLRVGIPMLIAPFFLDQNYWAARVSELGLGPPPIDIRTITAEELDNSLGDLLSGQYQAACTKMAIKVRAEGDGADVAKDVIARQLDLPEVNARCSLFPALRADWSHKSTGFLLSGAAAASLVRSEVLAWDDLDADNGIDWHERRQVAEGSSLTWTKVLCLLTNFLTFIFTILVDTFTLIFGLSTSAKPRKTVDISGEKADPVHEARIRRSEFDIQSIKEHMGVGTAEGLDVTLGKVWRAKVAAKSYEWFRERA